MQAGNVKALEREPEAGNGIGAWPSHDRAHQGPGSTLSGHRLARPGLRYPTPGARSHMPGNPTLLGPSPQLPAATGAGLRRRKWVSRVAPQGGYFREEGSTGEGSPSNRVRGWEDEEGENREEEWGGEDRAGMGRGVDAPGKGVNGHRSWGPESLSLAGYHKVLLLIRPPCLLHTSALWCLPGPSGSHPGPLLQWKENST